jgi:hypothetical protein
LSACTAARSETDPAQTASGLRHARFWPERQAHSCRVTLYQSAIALTNHLLESLLKNALIIRHSEDTIRTQDGVLNAFTVGTAEARARWGDEDLSRTIPAARKSGLISKEQQKRLRFVRERFRNA